MSGVLRKTLFDALMFAYLGMILLVAVVQPDEQQWMRLGVNFSLFLIAAVLGACLSMGLNRSHQASWHTLGESLFGASSKKAARSELTWYKTFAGWQLLIFLAATLIVGAIVTGTSWSELFDKDGFDGAVRLFSDLSQPNFAILPRVILNLIETLFIAFLATALAIPVAFVLSFFCAQNLMKGPVGYSVYLTLRTVLNFTRAIEALIWAIIFSVWVGIGPFAGMLAIMIHSVASLTKQYSEIIEGVSEGPLEGIRATGAGTLQTVWFAIVPQVILPYISFSVYRWDINVRMATLIGFVGGGGIGTMLIQYQGQAMWREVGCIVLVVAVVVWAMDQASAMIREALK